MKLFKYGVYALCASAMLSISSCFNLDEEPYFILKSLKKTMYQPKPMR